MARIKKTELLDADEILADSISAIGSRFATEGKLERSISRLPFLFFLFIMCAGVAYLGWNAFLLQIRSGNALFAKSQENRFLTRPIFPPRGIIYDRNGIPMVENKPIFGLVFEKDKFLKSGKDLPSLLNKLELTLGKPREYFLESGFPEDNNLKKLPPYIFLSVELSLDEVVSIAAQADLLPGIETFESYKRVYKDPEAFSHLLGFIGQVSPEELKKNPQLGKEESFGKNGLEMQLDDILRGTSGRKIVEVNSLGRETRFKLVEEPIPGQDIHLTIDSEMQSKAYEYLRHYSSEGTKGGSLAAIDPRDGSILALVSFPGFNSTDLSQGLTQAAYNKIAKDPLKPFFNRVIAGEFPSGSVIKPLVGAAALQEKLIDPNKRIYDEGFVEVPNIYHPDQAAIFMDWRKHGWIDFYDAMALSANVYFYMLGGGYRDQKGLGIDNLNKYYKLFGLGSKTGISLPGEKAGFVPNPENKKDFDRSNPVWRIGDTYNTSIGQGGLKLTPLQIGMATAAIANGGTLYKPRLLAEDPVQVVTSGFIDEFNLKQVVIGMRQAVLSGTVRNLSRLPIEVAAKTGTAQVTGPRKPHSWVTTIAPMNNPELVLAVMVENSGEGIRAAAPTAYDLYSWYFANRAKSSYQH